MFLFRFLVKNCALVWCPSANTRLADSIYRHSVCGCRKLRSTTNHSPIIARMQANQLSKLLKTIARFYTASNLKTIIEKTLFKRFRDISVYIKPDHRRCGYILCSFQ